jgi:hypothetical protein
MATLYELRPRIDNGEEAVLFLSHDHPGNEEGADLRIFITSTFDNRYRRKLHFVSRDQWSSPRSESFTWEELIYGSCGVEAKSDEWTLKAKFQRT